MVFIMILHRENGDRRPMIMPPIFAHFALVHLPDQEQSVRLKKQETRVSVTLQVATARFASHKMHFEDFDFDRETLL